MRFSIASDAALSRGGSASFRRYPSLLKYMYLFFAEFLLDGAIDIFPLLTPVLPTVAQELEEAAEDDVAREEDVVLGDGATGAGFTLTGVGDAIGDCFVVMTAGLAGACTGAGGGEGGWYAA